MDAGRLGVCILLAATTAHPALSMDPNPPQTSSSLAQRQRDVAQRGAQVMPFKLGATTHIFTKTATGGLQQVVVKDPKDADQIAMIRAHLSEIAGRFSRGDFSGPTDTHGAQMPGLERLKAAKRGEISIQYGELPDGAQIEYSSKSEDLIAALHEWFDAQLSDHGAAAMSGHEHTLQH